MARSDEPLTRVELAYLCERIMRKQRLLKLVLGIRNRRHQKNLKHRFNTGNRPGVVKREPRAWTEFRSCGEQVVRLQGEIAALNASARSSRARAFSEAEA
jgi:hypothetical protein